MTNICTDPKCSNSSELTCNCGEKAYHGLCEEHMYAYGWTKHPGECWEHEGMVDDINRIGWIDTDEKSKSFILHRLFETYITKPKNELFPEDVYIPKCAVYWTYPHNDVSVSQQYKKIAQSLHGYLFTNREVDELGEARTRVDLYSTLPPQVMIKSAKLN